MSKYTFTCEMGHAPVVMTVEAENDEAAMTMMMAKAKPHLAEVHSDKPMTDNQVMDVIKKGWKKEPM